MAGTVKALNTTFRIVNSEKQGLGLQIRIRKTVRNNPWKSTSAQIRLHFAAYEGHGGTFQGWPGEGISGAFSSRIRPGKSVRHRSGVRLTH